MRTATNAKNRNNISKQKPATENAEARLKDILEPEGSRNRGPCGESAGISSKGVSNEERYQLIAEAAYYRSEKRSFAPGYELEDWLAAEAEIEKTVL